MRMTRMRTSDIDNNNNNNNNDDNNDNDMTRTWDKDTAIKKKTRKMRDDDDKG